jgi:hypothetical protein
VSRTRLVLLAFIAILLVFDGSVGTGEERDATHNAAALYDSARVAAILESVNPALSDDELRRIGGAVMRSSDAYRLDPQLVTAVLLVESSARPWVRSPKGAVGLMQVMPYMVEGMELAGNLATIESNIEAGCAILADNIRRLGEDDGISSYFWGSDIRGVAYLDRVRAARAQVRRLSES